MPTTIRFPSITESEPICTSTSNQSPAPACPQSSLSKTTVEVGDGIGRVIETQLTSDPYHTVSTDTVYDGSGNVYSTSNPYWTTSDPTYGVTTSKYDPLHRILTKIDPDNSNYAQNWSYTGSTATFADEDGNQWQRTSDASGRLINVLEPTGESRAIYGNDLRLRCAQQSPCGESGWRWIVSSAPKELCL